MEWRGEARDTTRPNETVAEGVNQRKVDRVLANHSLSSTASQGRSNIPLSFLLLGLSRQARRSVPEWKTGEGRSREMNDGTRGSRSISPVNRSSPALFGSSHTRLLSLASCAPLRPSRMSVAKEVRRRGHRKEEKGKEWRAGWQGC